MKNSGRILLAALAMGGACPALAEEALPASRAAVDSSISFPRVSRATRKHGVFVPPRNVVMVSNGMTKGQIYTLLDVPHFSEGLFAVRKWNYILNFYTGEGDAFMSCQYQLRFDKDARVAGRWWKDGACADLVARLTADAAPPAAYYAATPPPAPASQMIERPARTYEFTFNFDSVAILPEGESVLRSVIGDAAAGQYSRIVVTGFTDTMGSQGYNDQLAINRAVAVADRLTDLLPRGSALRADAVAARGGRDLAVETGEQVRETRNRRVRIELMQLTGDVSGPSTSGR
jgi:outer membrane protein OmpA-like peptidoglycan-associated protein